MAVDLSVTSVEFQTIQNVLNLVDQAAKDLGTDARFYFASEIAKMFKQDVVTVSKRHNQRHANPTMGIKAALPDFLRK